MKISKYIIAGVVAIAGLATPSCVGDLDLTPNDPNVKLELTTAEEWDGFLARLYGNLYRDDVISTSDGGAGTFTRTHFNLQEVVADECFISQKWNDPGYQPLNFCTWSSDNEWIYAAFAREFFNVKMSSEFIKEIQTKGAAYIDADEVKARVAEAKAIRALSYYYMIDLFGRGPWIDENSVTGATPPTYDRKQLFEGVVADLKSAIADLKPASEQAYGRISREAGNMLLAKLYLNAEVYTGTPMYKECAEACKAVISTGLTLDPEYKYLFCADNDKRVACKENGGKGELLWVIPQQLGRMESWGGTTYLTTGCYVEGADTTVLNKLNSFGVPWSGLRLRPEVSKALKGDGRRLIYEGTYQEEIPNLADYDKNSCGYMCIKYSNALSTDYDNIAVRSMEKPVFNNNSQISNVDYPLFRLADTYLMLAECQLRGVQCDGLNYLNLVRERAGMPAVANLTADVVLHERQCELYMEGHRRSDLIRFGKYTGGEYIWSWKNAVFEGGSIPAYRALFPIPYQYVNTVGQNAGY